MWKDTIVCVCFCAISLIGGGVIGHGLTSFGLVERSPNGIKGELERLWDILVYGLIQNLLPLFIYLPFALMIDDTIVSFQLMRNQSNHDKKIDTAVRRIAKCYTIFFLLILFHGIIVGITHYIPFFRESYTLKLGTCISISVYCTRILSNDKSTRRNHADDIANFSLVVAFVYLAYSHFL